MIHKVVACDAEYKNLFSARIVNDGSDSIKFANDIRAADKGRNVDSFHVAFSDDGCVADVFVVKFEIVVVSGMGKWRRQDKRGYGGSGWNCFPLIWVREK